MARTQRPGWGRTAADGQDARPDFDLGKPRYKLRERTTAGGVERWVETWIFCPQCLARKEDGDLRGGYLYTFVDVPTRATPSGIYRRRKNLVPCFCKLGQHRKDHWDAKIGQVADASNYPPHELLGPAVAEAARDPEKDYAEILGPFGTPEDTQQPELRDVETPETPEPEQDELPL